MSVRKNPKSDLRRVYAVYIEMGMILSLCVLIVAFRVDLRVEENQDLVLSTQEVVQMEEILQTQQVEKPPPPPRPPVPVEVPNDEILEDDELDLDVFLDIDAEIDLPPPPPPAEEVEEVVEPEIFVIVEQMPCLLDDEGNCDPSNIAGLADLQRKMKYPEMARKAGVEGRVILQFVVDESGNVVDPMVLRGLGAGCDEEAIRAIRTAKFAPGKQRGKAVKVKMSLPISFVFRTRR